MYAPPKTLASARHTGSHPVTHAPDDTLVGVGIGVANIEKVGPWHLFAISKMISVLPSAFWFRLGVWIRHVFLMESRGKSITS